MAEAIGILTDDSAIDVVYLAQLARYSTNPGV
jgi:hypothetical protein